MPLIEWYALHLKGSQTAFYSRSVSQKKMKKQINARARGDREKSCNIKYFIHNYTHKEQRSNKENQRKKPQKMLFFPSYLKPRKNTETTRELQE